MIICRCIGIVLLVQALVCDGEPLWPGVKYDQRIPDVASVLGYAPGSRITSVDDTRRYFEALARSAPAQVRLFDYAVSWQGRRLFYAVVGSAGHIAALDQFEAGMQALANPATPRAQVDELLAQLPASVWLAYSVHGNEISSTDAALLTAWHLVAARDNALVDEVLANTLVFINPIQNPDGRARFVHGFNQELGLAPQADRQAAEHDERWPSGRVNHYLFDLNRDWLVATQPETRGHIRALRRWFPLVFVDLHEMGPDSSYFFAPDPAPHNPHVSTAQRASLELFGRNNARWFDQFGIDYFTREIFDAFYPGYGASWPSYYGAVAMTYEQASSRGLQIRRLDGSELTYLEAVRNHFVTSIATAQTAALNRSRLLTDFRSYRVAGVKDSNKDIRSYIISASPDRSRANKLAALLALQGVVVKRADVGFSACGQAWPAGSYVISLAQGSRRLIHTLLDPQVDMGQEFLAEQERRRSRDLPDEIYDVTGWSLPLMFGLEVTGCRRNVAVAGEVVAANQVRLGKMTNAGASVAYLAPWGTRSAIRLLAAALRQGLAVRSAARGFRTAQTSYPAGTLIFKLAGNPVDLGARLTRLARETGADVVGVSDSWVEEGPNFGSENVVGLRPPRIAMAWDQPTSPYSAGAARFVIERQFGYPVTVIRSQNLAGADLSGYDVLILPATRGEYGSGLAASIEPWVNAGGTLLALGSAVRFVADPEVNLISIRRESDVRSTPETHAEETEVSATVPGRLIASMAELNAQLAPQDQAPDAVAGVLARALVDTDHWLTAGVAPTVNVLVRGRDIYSPARLDAGRNVAYFAAAGDLLSSGYLWKENREQLAYKPFVVIESRGKGQVIAFTQDPNVRGYLDGLNVLFANAVLRAPAYSARAHR